jgi:hypothetical protein
LYLTIGTLPLIAIVLIASLVIFEIAGRVRAHANANADASPSTPQLLIADLRRVLLSHARGYWLLDTVEDRRGQPNSVQTVGGRADRS